MSVGGFKLASTRQVAASYGIEVAASPLDEDATEDDSLVDLAASEAALRLQTPLTPPDAMYQEESVSLVSREAPQSYTEEGAQGQGQTRDNQDSAETDYVDTDVSVLSLFHEDALTQAGFGFFQWTLFFVAGLGLAADAIEIYVVAYVIPSAEQELCMTDEQKGWLGAISFVGMMIGGLTWGSLADRMGRRRTLLSALSANALFSIITAFMPTYGLFMITRLCSGIGVGGSLPIVFTYYSEFLVKKHRGRHLSWLLLFWAVGGVFVALMAWAIIPRTGHGIMDSEGPHFSSWRIFLLVCTLPSVVATIGLIFLPESPRFLLEAGRDVEAMFVYQRIFKSNHSNKPGAEYQIFYQTKEGNIICKGHWNDALQVKLSELELPARRQSHSFPVPSHRGLWTELFEALEAFWGSFMQILWPPHTRVTVVLLSIWICTAFGFYGMAIWFPEYIKKLEEERYMSRSALEGNFSWHDEIVNSSLENTHFQEGHFHNVLFQHMVLNHVTFSNCSFFNCTFLDVRSSRTFFRNSSLRKVLFVDTDLYDYRFQDCDLENTTFRNTKAGCDLDFDINFRLSEVFLENLVAQLAIIPGNIVSSYILDGIGRVRTMTASLFLAGASAFFIWFLQSKAAVMAFQAVFNFISISGWNAVDVITTESYPATLRSTGYGFLSAVSRLAAILGSVCFGYFISISKAVPILTTAFVLVLGAGFSAKLHETKEVLM